MTAVRDRAIDTAAAWAETHADDLTWGAIAEGIIVQYEQQLADQAPALVLDQERSAVIEACAYVLAINGIRPDLRPPLAGVLERLRAENERQ